MNGKKKKKALPKRCCSPTVFQNKYMWEYSTDGSGHPVASDWFSSSIQSLFNNIAKRQKYNI